MQTRFQSSFKLGFLAENIGFLSLIGVQLLSILDGLTTTIGLLLGAAELNPFYFAVLPAKTLGLCLLAFLFLGRKPGRAVYAVTAFSVVLGFLWSHTVTSNVMVIWSCLA